MNKLTHDSKRKKAQRRAAAIPAVFTELTLALSKSDLAEALWGVCSLLGEDNEEAAVIAAVREVNVWRAARSARPLSAKPFETQASRALFPDAKVALSLLATLVKKAAEEDES